MAATEQRANIQVSVVIATRDRPRRLAHLLGALRDQTIGTDAFEVVVVADGADQRTLELLRAENARGELRLTVLRHMAPLGPGAARNAGWRRADGPVIAFTDDDCAPHPEWLANALRVLQPRSFVQGRTDPDPSEIANHGLFSRTLRVQEPGIQFETCNILYPREVLEELGGFDEHFGLAPGGEDTDLGWRAIEAEVKPRFASDAVVFHAVERLGPVGMLRVASRWSATMRIFSRHPRTRSMLYRGIFWNVWHYLLWRSVLALLAPPWLRRLLIRRHLLSLHRRARESNAEWPQIPFLLLHDLIECGAVAHGALRYRTLVL